MEVEIGDKVLEKAAKDIKYCIRNLDHPYRLVFRPLEDPIPTDEDGRYIWAEILGVEIEEVVDYH